MNEISLLYPQWLWLIPLILLVYWLYLRGHIKAAGPHLPAAEVKHPFAKDYGPSDFRRKPTKSITILLIALLFVLSLCQPVKPGASLPQPPVPVDLMLIIDTSVSMVLKDYQLEGKPVDRMTMTRGLLERFIQNYQGKRIGLVVLGDQPHILLQPSEDHKLASHLVSRLRTTVAGRQAALGDAVAVAATHIKNTDENNQTVMVLISDAVLPTGELSPIEGARRAAEQGARLHTIAVGSTSMQDQIDNSLIYEPADLQLLKQMAEITGGSAFHAVDVQAMDKALKVIQQQQQHIGDAERPQIQLPLYIWPLSLAVLLIVLITSRPYLNNQGNAV